MLYWGMFTTGFIVGGMLVLTLVQTNHSIRKENKFLGNTITKMGDENPDDVFARLTKVNFSTKSGKYN